MLSSSDEQMEDVCLFKEVICVAFVRLLDFLSSLLFSLIVYPVHTSIEREGISFIKSLSRSCWFCFLVALTGLK